MRAGQNCQTVQWISFPALCLIFIRRIFSISSKVHAHFSKQRDFCAAWSSPILFYSAAQFSPVQSLSRVWLFATPWITAQQASLSITNSWSLLKLTSIESVMPSSHLILCRPLLLLPPIPPSIRVFSNESSSNEVAKVLKFQLQH